MRIQGLRVKLPEVLWNYTFELFMCWFYEVQILKCALTELLYDTITILLYITVFPSVNKDTRLSICLPNYDKNNKNISKIKLHFIEAVSKNLLKLKILLKTVAI